MTRTIPAPQLEGATPRPWRAAEDGGFYNLRVGWFVLAGSDNDPTMAAFTGTPSSAAQADAALIVAAVNDYDRLRRIEEAARAAFTMLEASAYHRDYRHAAADAHELLGTALAAAPSRPSEEPR